MCIKNPIAAVELMSYTIMVTIIVLKLSNFFNFFFYNTNMIDKT